MTDKVRKNCLPPQIKLSTILPNISTTAPAVPTKRNGLSSPDHPSCRSLPCPLTSTKGEDIRLLFAWRGRLPQDGGGTANPLLFWAQNCSGFVKIRFCNRKRPISATDSPLPSMTGNQRGPKEPSIHDIRRNIPFPKQICNSAPSRGRFFDNLSPFLTQSSHFNGEINTKPHPRWRRIANLSPARGWRHYLFIIAAGRFPDRRAWRWEGWCRGRPARR